MKVKTFSIIAGTQACDAKCPFCVSKMTPDCGINSTKVQHGRNFKKACRYAMKCGCDTALITGKGEPTLSPNQITRYLEILDGFDFPIIELQTNGVRIMQEDYREYLREWYQLGLTTINISCVSHNVNHNREIYNKDYAPLNDIIYYLQKCGFSVRIGCTMVKGYINNIDKIEEFVNHVKRGAKKPFQITFRPVTLPRTTDNVNGVYEWTEAHLVSPIDIMRMQEYFENDTQTILTLPHGGKVYDYKGQNVCVTNCLTTTDNPDNIRQLIFFPDGTLRYDWEKTGAIIF